MAGFHRVNIQVTERQYRLLMAEAQAAGVQTGTLVRMLLHEDIASGRASKHLRMKQSRDRAKIEALAHEYAKRQVEVPE